MKRIRPALLKQRSHAVTTGASWCHGGPLFKCKCSAFMHITVTGTNSCEALKQSFPGSTQFISAHFKRRVLACWRLSWNLISKSCLGSQFDQRQPCLGCLVVFSTSLVLSLLLALYHWEWSPESCSFKWRIKYVMPYVLVFVCSFFFFIFQGVHVAILYLQ